MSDTLSHKEYQFLSQLAGLYEALRVSVKDPVRIHFPTEDNSNPLERGEGSHRLYIIDGVRERGKEVMERRIKEVGKDIVHHLDTHRVAHEFLGRAQEALTRNERREVIDNTSFTLTLLGKYATYVQQHQDLHQEHAFLLHPSCLPGQWYLLNEYTSSTLEKRWNPEQTLEGALDSIKTLQAVAPEFAAGESDVSKVKLTNARDSGIRYDDGSLRASFDTTMHLLKSAGYLM